MLTLSSPAKLNLFLCVVGKRPDGYHELASLFQTISLCDRLTFAFADQDEIICNDPTIPKDRSNLVMKAADLFRRKTGKKFAVKVDIDKKIPSQSGMGGGSGNAATTLWALNQLCGYPASVSELANWSAEIGSDISFFFSQGTAYCTGRGEQVKPVPALTNEPFWVVKPSIGLSTPAVYQNLNLIKLPKRNPEATLQTYLEGKTCPYNDLESSAFALQPQLEVLKHKLLCAGFHTVTMTGSGSAFFCYGEGDLNHLDVLSYKVNYINRSSDAWY